MGAWGIGLYQDDVAEDVREDYKSYLREGLNNEQAYEKIFIQYKEVINDSEDGPIFWFALADTMWELGKLNNEVKENQE